MSAHTSAGNPTADRWSLGYQRAADDLDELPGPVLQDVVRAILRVQPDPDDDPLYDAGYRAGLRTALP
ncbi:hypothetical protein ACLQ3C_09280 [Gordonia sp. DT30]|uniref:hypothetical protein n=1 Tax=Gordonia sp. DT30 TaxID=3416546 RepID=UPI003CEC1DBB